MRLLQKALTFDDVLLVPAHFRVLPRDVSLATRLTRNIRLNLPLLSAAMDTVTEARLAIAWPRKAASASSTRTCHRRSPGGRGGQGQALRIRRTQGPHHVTPT
jgi:IMP dehydrogenase